MLGRAERRERERKQAAASGQTLDAFCQVQIKRKMLTKLPPSVSPVRLCLTSRHHHYLNHGLVCLFVCLFVCLLSLYSTGKQERMKTKHISDETVGTDSQLRITLASKEVCYNGAS